MAKLLKLRRGTTSQHGSFTGAEGEVTVDTTKDTVVVHDGSTAGGTPLAKESAVTAIPAVIDEDNMSTNSATRPPSQQSVKAYVDAGDLSLIDEDNMSSNSATRPPSQQSVKAYVDAIPDVIDEDNLSSDSATRPPSQQSVKAYVDALPDVIDEDNMSSNSATRPSSQQSTKAYVDTTVAAHLLDEDNFATNSATKPPSQQSVKAYIQTVSNADAVTYAQINNSNLTGTATGVNLTLSGNLTVNGTTTTVATTNTTLTDNLLELNSGASSNANDAGILIERGSTGDNAIIAWDESADKFTVGTTTGTASATGNISITTGTIVANVEGNVTGTASSATNADTVDNLHAASFLRSDADDTATGGLTLSNNGQYPLKITGSNNAKIELSGSTDPYIRFHEGSTNKAYIQWDSNGYLTLFNEEANAVLRLKDDFTLSWDGSTHYTILHEGNVGSGQELSSKNVYVSNIIDGKGNLRDIPQNTQTSAYTLVGADAGKHIYISSGGVTVPSGLYGAGNAVTIINNSGSDQTITQGSGLTLYNTADASTGNRTLAGRGMATILFINSSAGYISGSGLS